jgi:hypothetical protein
VWGRYIVGGNILWLGQPQSVLREEIFEDNGSSSKKTIVYDTYVDFEVGICRGQIDALLRVWFDDTLILNNILDENAPETAVVDVDLSTLTRSDYDLTTMAARKPTLVLQQGASTQKVSASAAYKEGFGRAPAYRDLAVVRFQNINLALFGGQFPQLRFDIVTEATNETYMFESDEIADLDVEFLNVNPSTGLVYTQTTGDRYKILDWNTQAEMFEGYAESASLFFPLSSNHVLTTRSGDFGVIDPTFSDLQGRVTDSSPFGLTLLENVYGATIAKNIQFYDQSLLGNFDLVVATLADNRVGYVYYDYARERLYSNFLGGTTGISDEGTLDSDAFEVVDPTDLTPPGEDETPPPEYFPDTPDEDVVVDAPLDGSSDGETLVEGGTDSESLGFSPVTGGFLTPFGYRLPLSSAVFAPSEATIWQNALIYIGQTIRYYQFYIPNTPQSELRVVHAEVVARGNRLNTVLEPVTTTFANTALWGTDTTGVKLCNAFHSAADNSIILFFRCDTSLTYHIAKFDPDTLTILWKTESPYPFSTWSRSGDAGTRSAYNRFVFISLDNEVIEIDLSNGNMDVLGTLGDLGASPYEEDSAQVFDARTNSITYVSSNSGANRKVVRLFLQRLSPNRVSLGYIVRDIANRSEKTRDIVDTTGIDSITVDGFAALDQISVTSFISTLAEFYQIAVIDNGLKLEFVTKASLDTPTVVDPAIDIIVDTTKKTKSADTSLPDSVSVSFVSVAESGISENLQTISIREQDGDDFRVPNVREYALTVNEDPLIIRQYAEQTLTAIRSDEDRISVELMPSMLALTPHDPFEYHGAVYRIKESFLSAENHQGIGASRFISDTYAVSADLTTSGLSSGITQRSRNYRASVARPNILFCNAVSNEHAILAATGDQVAYSLVEAPTADIESTQVVLRTLEQLASVITEVDVPLSRRSTVVPSSPLFVSKTHTKAAHFGILEEKRDTPLPAMYRINEADELIVQFARQDTIDYIETLTLFDETPELVLEDSTQNLLIIDQELVQFGGYEVLDDRRVVFYNLIRGVRGTEMYTNHEVGDRVYLYTPDTMLTMRLDSEYTKRGPIGRIWIRDPVPAGYSPLEYCKFTDAGSSRPWSPTDLRVSYIEGNRERIRVRFKRRNPLTVDFENEGSGALSSTWGTSNFFITGVRLTNYREIDLDTEFYNKYFLDVPLNVRYENVIDDTNVTGLVVSFPQSQSFINSYPTLLYRLTVCEYTTNNEGGVVQGHPLIFDIPAGMMAEVFPLEPERDREASFPSTT